jgi:GH24 family phage-related lysozyme (muramidase)
MFDNPFTLDLLKRFEGYTAKPKWDHKQYSVGYSTRWTPGTPIGTREDHEAALRSETGAVDDYIGRNVKVPLTQGQRAALTSFGFNLGPGAIGKLLPDINAGSWDRVGNRMLSFTRAGDNPNALVDRRREEVRILNGGDNLSNTAAQGGGSMPYMTQALNAAGAIPGQAPVAQPVAGTTGTLGAALADFGRLPSERRKAMAEALLSQSFKTANSATNPLGALAAMAQAYAGKSLGGEYDDEKAARNRKLAEALYGAKDNDSLMRTMFASGDDDLVKAATAQKVAAAKPVAPEFGEIYDEQGRKQKVLINTRTGEYKVVGGARAASDGSEGGLYNKNLVYGEDAEGNPVPMQAGSHGEVVKSKLPEGVKLRREPVKMDGGTHWILLDPTTRQVIGQIPKDVAGEAREKETGKATGERIAEAPKVRANLDSSMSGLDRLAAEAKAVRDSAGLEAATGASSYLPNWPGGEAANTDARVQTLKSQIAFSVLQAMRDASKTGGALGAVSEKELGLLENNLAGLDPRQSLGAYKAALDRIITYTDEAKQRLGRAYKDTYGQDYAQPQAGGGAADDAAARLQARKQKFGLE